MTQEIDFKEDDGKEDAESQEFKKLIQKAIEISNKGKLEALIQCGYNESNAKQMSSINSNRNLPAYKLTQFCKAVGNNYIIEQIGEQLGLTILDKVKIDESKDDLVTQVTVLTNELNKYKKLLSKLVLTTQQNLNECTQLLIEQNLK